MTSVVLTEHELARIRAILFRDLRDAARAVADDAEAASQQEKMAGEDAFSYFQFWLLPTAELLNRIGWSTRTDVARVIADDRRRKLAALDDREGGE